MIQLQHPVALPVQALGVDAATAGAEVAEVADSDGS
jgi:hypothetical protein